MCSQLNHWNLHPRQPFKPPIPSIPSFTPRFTPSNTHSRTFAASPRIRTVVKSSYETVSPTSPDDVDSLMVIFSDARAARGNPTTVAPPPTPKPMRPALDPTPSMEEATRSPNVRRPKVSRVGWEYPCAWPAMLSKAKTTLATTRRDIFCNRRINTQGVDELIES